MFFVVLYVLSAVRGLVPGLCLNLRAPEIVAAATAEPACNLSEASPCCCQARKDTGSGSSSTPAAPERCPFCRLALGLTETPEFVYFEPLAAVRFAASFPAPAHIAALSVDGTWGSRAPPESPIA